MHSGKNFQKNGKTMMELGTYPFSEKYGWTQDQYGLSWQIMFMGDRPVTQIITPTLMFVGDNCGKAKEAIDFYMSIFHNTSLDHIMHYGPDQQGEKESNIAHASFTLEGEKFAAMDSAREHKFTFTEAISFMVNCDTQAEIDYYWEKLSAVPEAEQCGWVKDKYGVSWQIVPTNMDELMKGEDASATQRKTQAMLQMKKIDIQTIKQA
jgi:predicted 3-demethylubiquinone-9 3-methyltransferase (glyoxalase superfamily)